MKKHKKQRTSTGAGLYLQKKCWTESCHESTSISITKTPASPHDELPILHTNEGSEAGNIIVLSDDEEEEEEEEVVLIAIIRPASTIGRTKPEFHLVS